MAGRVGCKLNPAKVVQPSRPGVVLHPIHNESCPELLGRSSLLFGKFDDALGLGRRAAIRRGVRSIAQTSSS